MLASIVVGFSAAALVMASGWHLLLALPAFSVCGSFALVFLTILTAPGSAKRTAGAITPTQDAVHA
jgi:hypothetical protein